MWIILIVILAFVAAAAFSLYHDTRRMKEIAKELRLDAPDARVVDCPGPMFRFAVKWDEGNAYVVNNIRSNYLRIPLKNIDGCEFIDNSRQSVGIGSALVGSAAADAISGKNRGSVLRIALNDPERPRVEYRLTRPSYAEDFRVFARQVSALVDEITAETGKARG